MDKHITRTERTPFESVRGLGMLPPELECFAATISREAPFRLYVDILHGCSLIALVVIDSTVRAQIRIGYEDEILTLEGTWEGVPLTADEATRFLCLAHENRVLWPSYGWTTCPVPGGEPLLVCELYDRPDPRHLCADFLRDVRMVAYELARGLTVCTPGSMPRVHPTHGVRVH